MDIEINGLTDKQVAQFAIYREKWLNIGLNTEPTDIPAAEAAVRQCYQLAGLTAPNSIICTDSPLSAISLVNKRTQVTNQSLTQVLDKVLYGVRTRILNTLSTQVWDQVYNQVSNQVWIQVCNQVSNQVSNQVYNQVYDQVSNQIWNQMQFSQCYGCHETGLLSFYDYFREVCGLVKETEKLTGLIALAKCCGWWMPRKDFIIIQHRPCFISFDDNNILHCENKMAIKYKDGFGVWAIHGVRVDEQIVMKPNEQTIKQITEEKNAEVKRIRIERFGWDHYLTAINAKVINRRYNDIENTYETLVRTPDEMTILLTTCKTGRLFSLEVPSIILTCEQAQNWLHSGSQLDTIAGKTRVVGRS